MEELTEEEIKRAYKIVIMDLMKSLEQRVI